MEPGGGSVELKVLWMPGVDAQLSQFEIHLLKKSKKIRILIADDHYVVRMGVAAIINNEPDMEVVAEAADGAEALEFFERVQPDLALLDMRMPVKNGLKTAMEIRSKFPSARIIMLTAFEGDDGIYKALQAGAHGYVFKNVAGEKLIPALRAVMAGQCWIPKEATSRPGSQQMFEELPPRELEVLHEPAKGFANQKSPMRSTSPNTP
jgi:DNA-binding NarL/FixJ family response regulator